MRGALNLKGWAVALSDLAVFTQYAYDAAVQTVAQQVALFNEASQGAIVLRSRDHLGDYSEVAQWKRLSGLVRRRNAYGTGNVPQISLAMITDTMVKIAAGTPEVLMDPGQFNWILQNPRVAGVIVGQQLGPDMVRDMFNTAILGLVTTLTSVPDLIVDRDANPDVADQRANFAMFNDGQAKFGDRYNAITAWLMHSTPLFQLYANAMANKEQLFNFGNINVQRDQFGRLLIASDAPGLKAAGTPNKFLTLGLVPGAVTVDQNNDYTDNVQTLNGKENISRSFQAEWSYNLGVKGFAWNKQTGGKSPADSAIGTAGSWSRISGYNDRDLAGVVIRTNDAAA